MEVILYSPMSQLIFFVCVFEYWCFYRHFFSYPNKKVGGEFNLFYNCEQQELLPIKLTQKIYLLRLILYD